MKDILEFVGEIMNEVTYKRIVCQEDELKNYEYLKNNKEQIRNEIIDFCSLFWYNVCGDDYYEIGF